MIDRIYHLDRGYEVLKKSYQISVQKFEELTNDFVYSCIIALLFRLKVSKCQRILIEESFINCDKCY